MPSKVGSPEGPSCISLLLRPEELVRGPGVVRDDELERGTRIDPRVDVRRDAFGAVEERRIVVRGPYDEPVSINEIELVDDQVDVGALPGADDDDVDQGRGGVRNKKDRHQAGQADCDRSREPRNEGRSCRSSTHS